MAKLNIVLYEPEIPSNTGNIGRTCVATGTRLHLIEPLGFRLNEKSIKRAGMDYWDDLDVTRYIDYQDFLEKNPGAKIYMASTKAPQTYTEVQYEEDAYIMFGKESGGFVLIQNAGIIMLYIRLIQVLLLLMADLQSHRYSLPALPLPVFPHTRLSLQTFSLII